MHRIALPWLARVSLPAEAAPWKLAGFEIVPLMRDQPEFIER